VNYESDILSLRRFVKQKNRGNPMRHPPGIYQDYKNEINRQAWKNVATVAVAVVCACVAGWKDGCLKPAIYAAAAADAILALSGWGTDAINIQYALKLQNAGCASVPGW
jgi:hypothetical protein